MLLNCQIMNHLINLISLNIIDNQIFLLVNFSNLLIYLMIALQNDFSFKIIMFFSKLFDF